MYVLDQVTLHQCFEYKLPDLSNAVSRRQTKIGFVVKHMLKFFCVVLRVFVCRQLVQIFVLISMRGWISLKGRRQKIMSWLHDQNMVPFFLSQFSYVVSFVAMYCYYFMLLFHFSYCFGWLFLFFIEFISDNLIFFKFLFAVTVFGIICYFYINPSSANPTKWSNTLKQLLGNSRRIV